MPFLSRLGLILLVLAPLVGFQAHTQLNLLAAREAEIGQETQRLFDLLRTEQNRIVDSVQDILTVLATTGATELAGPRCQDTLQQLKERLPAYLVIEVTDLHGGVRCATDPRAVGAFIGDRLNIQRALSTGGFSVGEFGAARGIDKPILPFALPYHGPDGARAGVIAGLLDLGWLEDYLARKPLPHGAAILLTDAFGTIIARAPKQPDLSGQRLPERFRFLLQGEHQRVTEVDGLDGVRRVIAYAPPDGGGQGIMVGVGIDKAAAMRAVELAVLRSSALFAVVLTLSILGALWGMKRISTVRESERRLLKAVIENLPSGVFVAEAPTGRLLLRNEAVNRLVGAPAKPVDGISDYTAANGLHPDGRPYRADEYPLARAVLHGEAVAQEEILYRLTNGQLATFLVNAAPVRDPNGRVTLAVASATDITERKRLEDDLRLAKEEADRANLAKAKFLAAASHDLRQPMQSMFLFAEALRGHVTTEPGRHALGMLLQGLDTLKGLLDSLLDVSRLDARVVTPQIADVPLGPLLGEVGAAYAPIAAVKGLHLQVDSHCDTPVRSDRVLLGRMVRNLVENALRYTETGSITVHCRVADGRARIEVQDTGIGIPREHLTRIFEEFHQVGNPERDQQRGLGLGLAIVQHLSQLLDHSINVESEPGQGSLFRITVPLGEAPTKPCAPATPVADGNGRGRLAVLIDDDAIVLMGLQTLLQTWGYETVVATSTEQALERLDASGRRPDVIIADYRLREGRVGTEAVHRIREHVGAAVHGILLTGETENGIHQKAAELGLEVIVKPISAHQLHKVLDRHPGNSQPGS